MAHLHRSRAAHRAQAPRVTPDAALPLLHAADLLGIRTSVPRVEVQEHIDYQDARQWSATPTPERFDESVRALREHPDYAGPVQRHR